MKIKVEHKFKKCMKNVDVLKFEVLAPEDFWCEGLPPYTLNDVTEPYKHSSSPDGKPKLDS